MLNWEKLKSDLLSLNLNIDDLDTWVKKYKGLRKSAKAREKEFGLSFKDYLSIAIESGITDPNKIGRHIGEYNMGRLLDQGGYTVGNCRFITVKQNHDEMLENGGYRVSAEKRSGRTKETSTSIASQASKMSKGFRVTDPSGNVHEGRNLKDFCKQHGLNVGTMSSVCRGNKDAHKGWTGEYT